MSLFNTSNTNWGPHAVPFVVTSDGGVLLTFSRDE